MSRNKDSTVDSDTLSGSRQNPWTAKDITALSKKPKRIIELLTHSAPESVGAEAALAAILQRYDQLQAKHLDAKIPQAQLDEKFNQRKKQQDGSNETLMTAAAKHGHEAVFEALVGIGINPDNSFDKAKGGMQTKRKFYREKKWSIAAGVAVETSVDSKESTNHNAKPAPAMNTSQAAIILKPVATKDANVTEYHGLGSKNYVTMTKGKMGKIFVLSNIPVGSKVVITEPRLDKETGKTVQPIQYDRIELDHTGKLLTSKILGADSKEITDPQVVQGKSNIDQAWLERKKRAASLQSTEEMIMAHQPQASAAVSPFKTATVSPLNTAPAEVPRVSTNAKKTEVDRNTVAPDQVEVANYLNELNKAIANSIVTAGTEENARKNIKTLITKEPEGPDLLRVPPKKQSGGVLTEEQMAEINTFKLFSTSAAVKNAISPPVAPIVPVSPAAVPSETKDATALMDHATPKINDITGGIVGQVKNMRAILEARGNPNVPPGVTPISKEKQVAQQKQRKQAIK
jgi:hypothetical protein